MGFYLAITDGTSTIDLSAGVLDYVPINAPDDADAVSETIRVRLTGGLSTTLATVDTLGRMLTQAQRWSARKIQPRVFVNFDPNSSTYAAATTNRSLIITGTITPGVDVLKKQQLGTGTFEFDMYITRQNWWERDTEVTLGILDGQLSGVSENLIATNAVKPVSSSEVAATGDGANKHFTGTLTNKLFLTSSAFYMRATIGGVVGVTYNGIVDFTVQTVIRFNRAGGGNDGTFTIDPSTGDFDFNWLSLTPDNATAITVYIDTGYINSVEINPTLRASIDAGASTADVSVAGNLPAPAIIRNVNLSVSDSISEFYCGSLYGAAAAWPKLTLITTDVALGAGSAITADASCTLGNRIDASLTTDSETIMASWTFTSAEVKNMAGRWFLPFIKFTAAANTGDIPNIRYAWRVTDSIGGTISQTAQYRPDTTTALKLRQLGIVQLPPWVVHESDTPESISLALIGQRVSTGTKIASIDYIFLMPTDSYGQYNVVGNGGIGLLVDGSDDKYWIYSVSDQRGTVYKQYGDVMLYPGKYQRIYMLWQAVTEAGDNAPWDWQTRIQLSYRPRRRNL